MRRGWDRVRDTFDGDDDRGFRGGAPLNRYGRDFGANRGGNPGWTGANRYGGAFGATRGLRNTGGGGWSGRYASDFDEDRYTRGWQGVERGLRDPYDRDYGALDRPQGGWSGGGWQGRDPGGTYDRDFGYAGGGMDRDDEWERTGKTRNQTDAGDPFGDRQSRTPIRVMRGRDWSAGGRGMGRGGRSPYDESYRGWNQGVGDEPYYGHGGGYGGEFSGRGELNRGADEPFWRRTGRGRDWF
jgi:hypothetical protein